jgi:hypothetical protein
MSGNNAFANIIAAIALIVSLSGAAWSVYAFIISSEVRVLPIDEVIFMGDEGVPQIKVDVTLANLAYGDFDDIAESQDIDLQNGDRTVHFVAMRQASVRLGPQRSQDSGDCYSGAQGLIACITSDTPVVALEAGKIVTTSPIFELAETNCGLQNCTAPTRADLAAIMRGRVHFTYRVHTLRDHVRTFSCDLEMSADDVSYFTSVGFTNPRCMPSGASAQAKG